MLRGQLIENTNRFMEARVQCDLQGHAGAVQLAVTRSRAVAAEMSADGEPTSATQVLMLFLRYYSSGPDRDATMALIFMAALGVELGLEPDDEARCDAAGTDMQAKGRTR